jgi:hypothetical protein
LGLKPKRRVLTEARKFVLEHTLVVVTLMGLLFYGGGLLVYSRFYETFGLYETFGVSPDEVGLSYTAALTHLVPAFLLWLGHGSASSSPWPFSCGSSLRS